MTSTRHVFAGVGILLCCSAGQLGAQGALLDARLQVTLPPPGEVVGVRIVYRIIPEPGAREAPLSLLTPEPTRILSLRGVLDGQVPASSPVGLEALHLETVRNSYSEGSVRLPQNPGGGADPLSLEITYTVHGAWEAGGRATIPLVVPRWTPVQPTPRTFLADVEVPDGLTIIGSFPTSVVARPRPGEGGIYQIGLQGVPSMLVLRVVEGEGSPLTLERGLDALVIILLLAMGILGLRYLKRNPA